MRLYVFTLTGACLFLLLCPPADGQTSSNASCSDPEKLARTKTPSSLLSLAQQLTGTSAEARQRSRRILQRRRHP